MHFGSLVKEVAVVELQMLLGALLFGFYFRLLYFDTFVQLLALYRFDPSTRSPAPGCVGIASVASNNIAAFNIGPTLVVEMLTFRCLPSVYRGTCVGVGNEIWISFSWQPPHWMFSVLTQLHLVSISPSFLVYDFVAKCGETDF